jgi:hypothetical protein
MLKFRCGEQRKLKHLRDKIEVITYCKLVFPYVFDH